MGEWARPEAGGIIIVQGKGRAADTPDPFSYGYVLITVMNGYCIIEDSAYNASAVTGVHSSILMLLKDIT